ncbi:MAG: YHS domain-containing protein [Bacteroidetes bacterium]|nr:MAG: YHS domain-containing protein [Bacteroidota bacterium]
MTKKLFSGASVLLLLMMVSIHTAAQTRVKHFNLEKSTLAIQGYDPVAYFTDGKAVEGSKAFSVAFDGALYRFKSEQNKQAFKANPAKYEPQYGGWCAYAMGATGEKVEVDPETFKIIDGKLFLFFNKYFNNTLKTWNKDENSLHTKADANWKKIITQ